MTLLCSPKSPLNNTLNQTFTVERDSNNDVESSTEKLIAASSESSQIIASVLYDYLSVQNFSIKKERRETMIDPN